MENLTWLDDSSIHWGSRDPIHPAGRIIKEEKQDDQDGVYGVQWAGEASVFNTFFGTFDSFPQFPQLLARSWSNIRQGRNGSRLPNALPGLQLTKKDEGRLKGVLVVDVFFCCRRD